MSETEPILPFSGFTVLDLSGTVATATAGKLFADFGARVINIELPSGHPTRHLPPQRPDQPGETGNPRPSGGLHALLSPNKESFVFGLEDFADPERRGPLEAWIAEADLVLEAEPPGSLEAKGLGFESLTRLSPELILASLTWYGQTGPFALRPASEATILCEIGQVKMIGRPEGPPILPAGYLVQVMGGVTGFVAATGELLGRVLSPARPPTHLDVSLFEAAMCLTEPAPVAFVNGGQLLPRLGINRFLPTFPAGPYRAKEGFVGVTALTPVQWKNFCELLELPDLAKDRRHRTAAGRLYNADEIDAQLVPALARRSAEEWFHAGQALRIPLTTVPTQADLLESEQLRALDAFCRIEDPNLGSFEIPAAPFRLHRTPALRTGKVARLGENAAVGVGLANAAERRKQHELIDREISAWTAVRERDEVVAQILALGIPAAGVLDVNEVLAHPQLEAREFWQWMEREYVGMQPNPVTPYRTGQGPNGIDWPAPTLGEQSREVLNQLLGLSDRELDALQKQGIIGTEARLGA
jgi:crotonobetainyl-CoA:carnitine CoA-transferase CaiB-like acyl-CoA transferase